METIKTVFQDFSLVNGTWFVEGTQVRPQDITTGAILTVEGELDDISGAGQTRAAHGLCTGIPKERQFHYDVEGAGHYGIFSGRRWRDMAYPVVRDFIARYNDPAKAVATSRALVAEAALQVAAAPTTRSVVKRTARKPSATKG